MRIVVCVKEVLDPDAVGAYAVAGGLVIGDDGKSLTQTTIPRLMNGYDEQAIEAALRIRDAGADCTVDVISVGSDLTAMLRHAKSLGVDGIAGIDPAGAELDGYATASLLAAHIKATGGADVVLAGRQASDDDQGVVPVLLAELLAAPVVTIARSVELSDGSAVKVVRATPEGDEVVEADCPVVVTVSSELGEPRYPTMPQKMAARKVNPDEVAVADLGVGDETLSGRVGVARQFVPEIQGHCEFIEGASAAEMADKLIDRLIQENAIPQGGRS